MVVNVGDKFFDWTIKEKITNAWYICTCKCGNEKLISRSILKRNKSKKCSDCNHKDISNRVEDLSGRQFGEWQVLSRHGSTKHHQPLWSCLCNKCGKISVVRATHLKTGSSKRCTKCNSHQGIHCRIWTALKSDAKKRKIPVEITIEDLWKLWLKQNGKCAISNVEITLPIHRDDKYTASVDRIDSTQSYNINNIQWVHKIVNRIKYTLSLNDFISLSHSIASNQSNPNSEWFKLDIFPQGYKK